MKKCIIVPDSFKGTMSSHEVCCIMKERVEFHFPNCDIRAIPIADGGEGTVDCFLHAIKEAEKVMVDTTDPFGDEIKAYYAKIGETAIIEMASAAGIGLAENRLNPEKTTTYGVGIIMMDAIRRGCKELIIGLGGSCTNDGGTGMARAMGTKFFDETGSEFAPKSFEFKRISKIDNTETINILKGCKVLGMCDIDNPMYGENGAAYVFSPQKGASDEMVKRLDSSLIALADKIVKYLGKDVSNEKGGGAAGAFGAGIIAFLDGKLQSGIETILNIINFDEMLPETDMIFTGEGKIDSQSIQGKAIVGISSKASNKNIPVIAVVGSIGNEAEMSYEKGVTSIFSINLQPMPFEKAKVLSKTNLKFTMDSILRLYKSVMK